jgi:hypothetical protein
VVEEVAGFFEARTMAEHLAVSAAVTGSMLRSCTGRADKAVVLAWSARLGCFAVISLSLL